MPDSKSGDDSIARIGHADGFACRTGMVSTGVEIAGVETTWVQIPHKCVFPGRLSQLCLVRPDRLQLFE